MKVEAIVKPTRCLKLEDFLSTAIKRMEEEDSTALPVIDSGGNLVGVVSLASTQAAIDRSPELSLENTLVETATLPQTFDCTGDDEVSDLLPKATKHDLGQIAVTDSSGRILGVADLAAFRHRVDEKLDEAVEETFPASDPISPA